MPPTPLRVVHIEDSPRDVELTAHALQQQGFAAEVVRVDSADALHLALASEPDVILSDYRMPGFDVRSALEIRRKHGANVPFIILSSAIGEEEAVTLLHEGADDYLLKGRMGRLGSAITRELAHRRVQEQRRHDQERLQEREGLYSALFQQAPIPMFVFDRETLRIAAVNDKAVRLYGWSPEEFLTMTIDQICRSEHKAAEVRGMFESLMPGVAVSVGERPHRKKDGTLVDVDVSVVGLQLGGVPVVHLVCQDLTERKQLEQKYLHSQKMEAVGLLAGGIAHDFNNLLCVIMGYSELLLSRPGPGGRDSAELKEIRSAGVRASELTRQLLAFSRQQVLEVQELNLNDAVQNVRRMLARVIGEHVTVAVEPTADLPLVLCDPGQIDQVLLNLAINARDAMKDGGRLTLATGSAELSEAEAAALEIPAGRYARIAVRDTGCGITPEVRKRLFEPFYTTKEPGKGTGLGLCTAYGIVRQSGGAIEVASEVGRGSTFTVYLPLAAAKPRDKSAAPRPVGGARGHETILVVEDDPLVREFVVSILQRGGYQVHAATGPQEALKQFDGLSDQVDLLFTDLVMPQMNGRALAEMLTANRPGLRVLFTSGYTDDHEVRQGVITDELPFVRKPFTFDTLLAKVREVLDAAPLSRPIAAAQAPPVT